MALKLNIQSSDVGVGFTDAYVRITNFHGDKNVVRFMYEFSANEEARQLNASPVGQNMCDCPLPDGALLPALYAHLKLQPGFEQAVDC